MPLSEILAIDGKVLTLMPFSDDVSGIALGTRQGIVKRVKPEYLSNRDDWDLISLTDGDQVVGAVSLATGDEDLVFVTSDAQLLRFAASTVRPQGRSGGGVAGIKLGPGARVVSFGAVNAETDAEVVTIAGSADALPGTQTGAVKVSPLSIYPSKGRATGGVRCHRLLKGEDALILGWVGHAPAVACASSGSPVELPPSNDKRDGSGVPSAQPILAVSSPATRLLGTQVVEH